MFKLKIASIFVLIVSLSPFNSPKELCEVESFAACTWTYEEGFEVGKQLGNSETYYKENYNEYDATRKLPCAFYVVGVIEGYANAV